MIYAIESSICLLILWGFYEIALKKDTDHSRNRVYLLSSLLFSAFIPLVKFTIPGQSSLLTSQGLTGVLFPEITVNVSGTSAGNINGLSDPVTTIYLIGMAISGLFFTAGCIRIAVLVFRFGSMERVVRYDSTNTACFSALGYIFITKNISGSDAERMITHERSHIRRLHHLDLLFACAISTLQWFNPAIYLTRRSLQALHEYEADDECLRHGEEIGAYQELLFSSAINTSAVLLSNTFSKKSLLKKRFIMMTKKKSGGFASLKLILVIPMAAILMLFFACKQKASPEKNIASAQNEMVQSDVVYDTTNSKTDKNVFAVVDEMPQFPGGDTALVGFIYRNIKYPDEAKEKEIQGKVILRFAIDAEGNVGDIVIVKSADPLLDQAAYDVLKKCPAWIPGKNAGKRVAVYYTVPVTFRLN